MKRIKIIDIDLSVLTDLLSGKNVLILENKLPEGSEVLDGGCIGEKLRLVVANTEFEGVDDISVPPNLPEPVFQVWENKDYDN